MNTKERTIEELTSEAFSDWRNDGDDAVLRTLLEKAWNAGAHYAVMHDWDDDTLDAYLSDPASLTAWENDEGGAIPLDHDTDADDDAPSHQLHGDAMAVKYV